MNKKDLSIGAAFSVAALVIIYLPWQTLQTLCVAALLLSLVVIQYRNLTLGFVITLFFLPFSLRLNLSQTNDALSFDLIFLLFDNLALIVIWRLWRKRENPLAGWSRWIIAAVGLFFIAILLSFVFSIDKGITVRKLWNVAQYAIGFAVMAALWREYGLPLIKRSLWALVGTGGILGLYSIVLFYLQWPIGDAWNMRLWLIEHTVRVLHGIRTYEVFSSGDNNWILINGPLRAVGTFPTPMGLGQYLFVSLMICAAFIITAPAHTRFFRPGEKPAEPQDVGTVAEFIGVSNRNELLLCYLVLILGLITEIVTYSRGVWFGAALGLVLVLGLGLLKNILPAPRVRKAQANTAFKFKNLLVPVVVTVVIVAATTVAGTFLPLPYPANKAVAASSYDSNQVQLNNRLTEALDATNESNQVRFTVWKHALDLFRERPIFGRGLGTFAVGDTTNIASQPKDLQSPLYSSTYAHNIYLDFLAETGAVGFLSYMFLIILSVYYAWQLWRQANPNWQIVGVIVIAVTAAMALHNIFDDMFLVPKNGLTIFMILALAFVGKSLNNQPNGTLNTKPTTAVMAAR